MRGGRCDQLLVPSYYLRPHRQHHGIIRVRQVEEHTATLLPAVMSADAIASEVGTLT